jgi:multidrug resistance efflux pump
MQRHPVAETVAANKFLFWLFGLAGVALVLAGLFSLRMDKTIRAAGVVMAEEEFYVFAPARGVLERHQVSIGQKVKAGQPLFTLSGEDLDLRILEKQRQLVEIRGEVKAADLALREAEIRPGDPALITARNRLDLLRQIQGIQGEIMAAWDRLEGERAIRGLEYNLQRVATLRTQLEEVDSRVLAEWQEAGILGLEKERVLQKREKLVELGSVLERELEVLQRQRSGLKVHSPINGTVVDIYYRYPGMALEEGQRVLKIVNVDAGYRVKAFVGERNIDMLRVGTPARMESQVFDSMFEGYVLGRVRRVVGEANRATDSPRDGQPHYEVTIDVDESPYPLVLGSRVHVDFLLGRESLLGLLMNRPTERREVAVEVAGEL